MKRKVFTLIAILSGVTAQIANAGSDGNINFTGQLIAQTCTIAVDGVVTPAPATVTLPTITTSNLIVAGEVAGQTGFNIQLSHCVGTASTAAAFFESGSTVDPISGNLHNDAGTAENVQLQLVDSHTGSPIQAGKTNQLTNTTRNPIDSSGNANMPYAVQYYATGATTAGSVVSAVTYSVNYQ